MSVPSLERLAARADLCRLLAACFYQPGPEFEEEDAFGSLRKAADAVSPEMAGLATTLGAHFAAQPVLDLQIEYTRLFLHPSGPLIRPYESFWIGDADPARAQDAMLAVVATYREAGHEVSDEFRDLPDHIAAELEFLYTLLFAEARARFRNDRTAERTAAELRRNFVDRHLGRWVGPFTAALGAEAGRPFYRVLAELTGRFVSAERG